MIKLVNGMDLENNAAILGQMFQARKRLFSDRLQWDVTIDEKGWEVDQYDPLHPLYLIATDSGNTHKGSLRLLPTTGDTMLRDIFTPIFDGTVIESPFIWECTRFCIENTTRDKTSKGLHRVTTELLLGICEVGLRSGIEHVVGVFDRRMISIYQRGGWPPEIVGESGTGRDAVFLGIWEVSKAYQSAIQKAGGFEGSVLDPVSRKRAARLLTAA